jgi:DNA repair exonuclease SbcCD ATPase subunit
MSDSLLRAAAEAQAHDLTERKSLAQFIADLEQKKNEALEEWNAKMTAWTKMSEAIKAARKQQKSVGKEMARKKQEYQKQLDTLVGELDEQKKANRLALNHKTAELESFISGGGPTCGSDPEVERLDQELRQLEEHRLRLVAQKDTLDGKRSPSLLDKVRSDFSEAIDRIQAVHEHVTHKPVVRPATMDGTDVQALLSQLINEIRDALIRHQ